MFKTANIITALLVSLGVSANASATPYGGVEFPGGAASFADAVVGYSPGSDVGPGWDDPLAALGIPDYPGTNTAVSLGDDGWLKLQFTDNSLTTSGNNANDLWIFEIGNAIETFNVQISTDDITYIDLGNFSGQPGGIDIDANISVIPSTLYSYILLTDVTGNQTGFPFGEADIDAVGAISSAPPVDIPAVPVPAAFWLFGTALIGFIGMSRRRKVA